MNQNPVEHQVARNRFVLPAGHQQAVLDYRLIKDDNQAVQGVNFTHTYVPPDCRGQGLAEKLVRQGLKWAREQDLQIEASCWYVAKFLR